MKSNACGNCKYAVSKYESKGAFFDKWDRFIVTCLKLGNSEITPPLHVFISTCGCASWEKGD